MRIKKLRSEAKCGMVADLGKEGWEREPRGQAALARISHSFGATLQTN